MPTNAQGLTSSPPSNVPSDDEDQTQAQEAQAGAQVQPGQELGALPQEGRRAEGAPLNAEAPSYQILDDRDGNIAKITFHRDGCEPMVVQRPNAEDATLMAVWQLLEVQRRSARRRRQLQTAINKAHATLLPFLSTSSSSPIIHYNRHSRGEKGAVLPSEPIPWLTKELPERVATKIQDTYFLQIEEHVTDRHGNPYVPAQRDNGNGKKKWRGSMLAGKFPHAIISAKQTGDSATTPRTDEFLCGASKNVGLTVRLKRFVDSKPVDCSETELLNLITDAYTPTQRAEWGYLESKMVVYIYLEFADDQDAGTPVGVSAFERPPEHGAILSPIEAPPSYLNDRKPSFYELTMERGVASIELSFQDGVTSNNLTKAHKNRRFRFVVKAINPFLAPLDGMTALSSGFMIKSVLHNDVQSNERYVRGPDGSIIDSGPTDAPVLPD